jgi:hypothetical protein
LSYLALEEESHFFGLQSLTFADVVILALGHIGPAAESATARLSEFLQPGSRTTRGPVRGGPQPNAKTAVVEFALERITGKKPQVPDTPSPFSRGGRRTRIPTDTGASSAEQNVPLYQGQSFESWVEQVIRHHGGGDATLGYEVFIALRALAIVEPKTKVDHAFDELKRRAQNELSPKGLSTLVEGLCALGIGEHAEEAATVTLQVLRQQPLPRRFAEFPVIDGPPLGEPIRFAEADFREQSNLFLTVVRGLQMLDHDIAIRKIREEFQHGSDASRWWLLWIRKVDSPLKTWADDLNPLIPTLLGTSRGSNLPIARESIELLGPAVDQHAEAMARVREAVSEERLWDVASAVLFKSLVKPGTIEQALELAKSSDPPTAMAGAAGLVLRANEPPLQDTWVDSVMTLWQSPEWAVTTERGQSIRRRLLESLKSKFQEDGNRFQAGQINFSREQTLAFADLLERDSRQVEDPAFRQMILTVRDALLQFLQPEDQQP